MIIPGFISNRITPTSSPPVTLLSQLDVTTASQNARVKVNKFKMPLLVSAGVVLLGFSGHEYLQRINSESKIADCASATLCIERGADLNKEQKYNAAVEFFSQAIKFDSKNASALMVLIAIWAQLTYKMAPFSMYFQYVLKNYVF